MEKKNITVVVNFVDQKMSSNSHYIQAITIVMTISEYVSIVSQV